MCSSRSTPVPTSPVQVTFTRVPTTARTGRRSPMPQPLARITDIAFDPQASGAGLRRDRRRRAQSPGTGIYKSSDFGLIWTRIDDGSARHERLADDRHRHPPPARAVRRGRERKLPLARRWCYVAEGAELTRQPLPLRRRRLHAPLCCRLEWALLFERPGGHLDPGGRRPRPAADPGAGLSRGERPHDPLRGDRQAAPRVPPPCRREWRTAARAGR